jgi:hypothetical protein
MAAVLACGDGAVLCGRAAAYLHGLTRARPACPEVLARTERRIPGVRTIRGRAGIDPRDATTARGIPVTAVPRTLVDLAAVLPPRALARACHEAEVRHRTTPAAVWAALRRRPSARGRGRAAADPRRRRARGPEPAGGAVPRADRGGRPAAADHQPPRRRPPRRLPLARSPTVELDGYRFHNSRHSWEQDRRRERQAYARGDDFRRFTYGDVFERPQPTLRELISALFHR